MASDSTSSERCVLRRVSSAHYTPGNPIVIQPAAFRPTDDDVDGLSVYREASEGGATPEQLVAAGRPGGSYCVVRLPVAQLEQMGISLVPAEVPEGPPGHTLIPEINSVAYHAGDSKKHLKSLSKRLAELASANIIRAPPPLP